MVSPTAPLVLEAFRPCFGLPETPSDLRVQVMSPYDWTGLGIVCNNDGMETTSSPKEAATMNTICDQCGMPIPSGKVLTFEIPLPHPTRHDLTEPIEVGPCCEHKPKGADILHPAPLWTV